MRTGLMGIIAIAVLSSAALASTAPASRHSVAQSQRAVAAGLAAPARADAAGDDVRRKAAEVLAFSGVGPGDKVVDLLPGAGYWTRIFSGIVGPGGHVYAVWPGAAAAYAAKPRPAIDALHLANVTTSVLGAGEIVSAPEPVDIVWTVQNYHDIPNNGVGAAGLDLLNAQAFAALKPGGTYIVIDHAGTPGSGLGETSTKHRIDPAIVKAGVLKAGFLWVGESKVLSSAQDDHSLAIFDPLIRGKTDQFVYRFRKPR